MALARTDIDLRSAVGLFGTPQPDLETAHGAPMTPAEWLADGRDPQAVAEWIRFL